MASHSFKKEILFRQMSYFTANNVAMESKTIDITIGITRLTSYKNTNYTLLHL